MGHHLYYTRTRAPARASSYHRRWRQNRQDPRRDCSPPPPAPHPPPPPGAPPPRLWLVVSAHAWVPTRHQPIRLQSGPLMSRWARPCRIPLDGVPERNHRLGPRSTCGGASVRDAGAGRAPYEGACPSLLAHACRATQNAEDAQGARPPRSCTLGSMPRMRRAWPSHLLAPARQARCAGWGLGVQRRPRRRRGAAAGAWIFSSCADGR
jgi:hypothetical protein